MSADCIAWFCRSTLPFQTLLISIISRLSWFWPNLLLCYSIIIAQLPLFYPIKIYHRVPNFLHAHAYLSQFRIKCGLWRLAFKFTRLLAGYFTTQTFQFLLNVPVLVYPTSTGSALPCKGGSENPSFVKPLHSAGTNICLVFIYPHRGPFPPTYMRSSVGSYWLDTDSL